MLLLLAVLITPQPPAKMSHSSPTTVSHQSSASLPAAPPLPLPRPRPSPLQPIYSQSHKKVFPDFYVLGCYSTGSDVQDTDMLIDKALMDVNESPVYLLLNPAINLSQKDLPVIIYESELHVIDESPQLIFVRSNYTIETVEAERIL